VLANHFLAKFSQLAGGRVKEVSREAMEVLLDYSWPGNIRQLENAMEHAVAISGTAQEITTKMLPPEVCEPADGMMVPSVMIPDEGINFVSVVSQLERELILRCLEKTGGNKRQAARLLNLSRTTLIDKLQRLNVANEVAVA
jgi:DNA-binding NtrC family response regulator